MPDARVLAVAPRAMDRPSTRTPPPSASHRDSDRASTTRPVHSQSPPPRSHYPDPHLAPPKPAGTGNTATPEDETDRHSALPPPANRRPAEHPCVHPTDARDSDDRSRQSDESASIDGSSRNRSARMQPARSML